MITISIVAIVISLFALAVSILVLLQNKKDAFQTIAAMVITQKNYFIEMYSRYGNDIDNNERSKYVVYEAAANYFNTLENACALYLKKGINRELFESVFKEELLTVPKQTGVAAFLEKCDINGDTETYENIRKVIFIIENKKKKG